MCPLLEKHSTQGLNEKTIKQEQWQNQIKTFVVIMMDYPSQAILKSAEIKSYHTRISDSQERPQVTDISVTLSLIIHHWTSNKSIWRIRLIHRNLWVTLGEIIQTQEAVLYSVGRKGKRQVEDVFEIGSQPWSALHPHTCWHLVLIASALCPIYPIYSITLWAWVKLHLIDLLQGLSFLLMKPSSIV